jgi:hypothetical protein
MFKLRKNWRALSMINEKKYPHATAFLKQHPGWTIDQAIAYIEQQIELRNRGVRE